MSVLVGGRARAYLLSAKGAAVISKPGQRPRTRGGPEPTSAESAIHLLVRPRMPISTGIETLNRAFSAASMERLNPWGDAPG